MAQWTFLTNHGLVLNFLARDPLITPNRLSAQIGITERAVRKIIADLNEQKLDNIVFNNSWTQGVRMRLDGMIFDLDGTLTDTFAVCFAAFREALLAFTNRLFTDEEILYEPWAPITAWRNGEIARLKGLQN